MGAQRIFGAAAAALALGGCGPAAQVAAPGDYAVGDPGGLLAPVDLPIPNLPQETPVWCWAAVAQQIILASKGPEQTPSQCHLVAVANGAPPEVCCVGQDPRCVRTGSIPQIQGLIRQYSGRTSTAAGPADPMTLYRTLQQGHAVILGLQPVQGAGHVVVVRGMSFVDTPAGAEAVVHLNDPMGLQSQAVPFRAIAPYWSGAVIVN